MYTQRVEERGQAAVEESQTRLAPMQQEMEATLKAVKMQTSEDQAILQQHREELSDLNTQALNTVNDFLSNELQQDLPTGETPGDALVLLFCNTLTTPPHLHHVPAQRRSFTNVCLLRISKQTNGSEGTLKFYFYAIHI